jgi:hypothetical protein
MLLAEVNYHSNASFHQLPSNFFRSATNIGACRMLAWGKTLDGMSHLYKIVHFECGLCLVSLNKD